MKNIIQELIWLIYTITLACALSITELKHTMRKRFSDETAHGPMELGCIGMVSYEGEFMYTSPGAEDICGLYVIGDVNENVRIEVTDFSVTCDKQSLVALVDGWEMQGQFYPGIYDHAKSVDERYKTYCGKNAPTKVFVASQNVALMQFRLPIKGQGFKIKISFERSHQPCHAVSMEEEGMVTMTNYGGRRNCSLSIISPESLQLVSLDVGETPEGVTAQLFETGAMFKCQKRSRHDYLELLTGSGFDPAYMWRTIDMCGRDTKPEPLYWRLGCHHSVIRLVSSGEFYNSVTLQYRPINEQEMVEVNDQTC